MKTKIITKVFRIHCLGTMNVCTKLYKTLSGEQVCFYKISQQSIQWLHKYLRVTPDSLGTDEHKVALKAYILATSPLHSLTSRRLLIIRKLLLKLRIATILTDTC